MKKLRFVYLLQAGERNLYILYYSNLYIFLGIAAQQDDCLQDQDLQRWARMPDKFGKVLQFLEDLTQQVNVFSR